MHLSHPPGNSINDHINIDEFPLRYSSVYDAMDCVMRLGRGALMAKLDVRSAFRLCPVRPKDHHLLGMRWQGQYIFDRVLGLGLRSAPFIFNSLATAIEWLAREAGIEEIHYLDDFFLPAHPAQRSVSTILPRSSPSPSQRISKKVHRRPWNSSAFSWTRPISRPA